MGTAIGAALTKVKVKHLKLAISTGIAIMLFLWVLQPKYAFVLSFFFVSMVSGLIFTSALSAATGKIRSGLFSLDAWGAVAMTLLLPILLEYIGFQVSGFIVATLLLVTIALHQPISTPN